MLLNYESLDSTNEEAHRLLAAGRIEGVTGILTASQTAGKGTRGRQWISPPGCGLYLSIVHPFDSTGPAPLTPIFTLAAGVACAETLADLTGLAAQLKPVNDIYMEDRKLGGILTESIVRDGAFRAMVTGIGINLKGHEAVCAHAEDTGNRATSLEEHLPPHARDAWTREAARTELAEALMKAVDFWYGRIRAGESRTILEAYMRHKLAGYDMPEAVLTGGI